MNLKNYFNKITYFFKTKFTKPHLVVCKEAFKGCEFDYSSLLSLEHTKLKEMYRYFSRYNKIVWTSGKYYNNLLAKRDIGICIKLLNIISAESNWYNKCSSKKSENTIYINCKNINRFFSKEYIDDFFKPMQSNHLDQYIYAIRIEKAYHLYHKIRYERETFWWD